MKPTSAVGPILRGALVLPALVLALAATEARASTAANTQITNTATVNFNDAAGVAQAAVTATATVTVTLVPSAVVLSSPPNQTIAQGTSATLTYTVTGTANGPDTYDLASTAAPTNMTGTVTVALPATVALGGTTLAADAVAAATSITVPYDGVSDGSVNGIVATDHVVIGLNEYVVQSVNEASGPNTSTIVLTSAITGATVGAGQIIGERQTFTATVPSGTVATGASGSQSVSTTATSTSGARPATTQTTPTVITVDRPTLTVTKTVSVDGGTSFAATGNAVPGTILVYRIVAHNGGATPAQAVAFTDAMPAYLTYVAGSARYATASATAYAAASVLTDDGADADGYGFATGNVSYNPGGATGTVAGGADLVLFYRATIN